MLCNLPCFMEYTLLNIFFAQIAVCTLLLALANHISDYSFLYRNRIKWLHIFYFVKTLCFLFLSMFTKQHPSLPIHHQQSATRTCLWCWHIALYGWDFEWRCCWGPCISRLHGKCSRKCRSQEERTPKPIGNKTPAHYFHICMWRNLWKCKELPDK